MPYAGIDVRQLRHHFGFGSAIAINAMHIPNYTEFFKENFEWAVFENEAKWYANEPSPGNVDYSDADRLYQFCEENGIKVRGHCIFWAVDEHVPGWVRSLNTEELEGLWITGWRVQSATGMESSSIGMSIMRCCMGISLPGIWEKKYGSICIRGPENWIQMSNYS